jgi:hypothetical protein
VPVLIATAKAVNANSYLTVALADQILDRRLYTAKWNAAGTTPSAEGYLVDGATLAGETSVAIDTGTGVFTAGSKVKFAEHDTVYTVGSTLSAPGTITITPALTDDVADDETIERFSANEKEKALIWTTNILDSMMDWFGTKRTVEQRLRWPRSGVVDADGQYYDADTIPEELEIAVAELALHFLERNTFKAPTILGQGVSSFKVGAIEADVDSLQTVDTIPENILALLSTLGVLYEDAKSGTRILPMRRA